MTNDKRYSGQNYETPDMTLLTLVVEQCIASSTGASLDDMDKNGIYDENF